MAGNILNELENLINRVSQKKTAALKAAADVSTKLDSADDGTEKASTGQQAKDMQKAKDEQYADNTVDTGAKDNKAGESVNKSTDGASAVSTSGQEGTSGGKLGPGKEVSDDPKNAPDIPDTNGFSSGAFKSAAAQCLKIAAALEKAAEATIDPMQRALVGMLRNHPDEAIRKQAQAMPDDELGASAADALMQDIEAGNVSDEEAAQILQEAVESGVISEEEVAQAAQAAQQAMMEAGGEAGIGGPEAGMEGGAEGGMPPEEEMMEAKLASVAVGPDHPQYLEKLSSLYADDMRAGYTYGMQLADRLRKIAEEEEKEEKEEKKDEGEPKGKSKGEAAPAKGSPLGGQETPEEEAAEAGAMPADPMAAVAPAGPNEQAELAAVGGELGLTPEQLEQLMAAPVAPEEAMAMGKVASVLKRSGVPYKTRVRTVLLNKVAALNR